MTNFRDGYEFGSPRAMQEALAEADKTTLMLGAGATFFDTIDEATVQIGLNIDPRQHALLSEEAGSRQFAIYFDLRRLSDSLHPTPTDIAPERLRRLYELFGTHKFSLLKITNVFGEYNTDRQYKKTPINPSGTDYLGSSTNEQKLLSLQAVSGLLASGGRLHIQEFQTPSLGLAPKLLLNPEILGDYGYEDISLRLFAGSSIADDSPPFEITAKKM